MTNFFDLPPELHAKILLKLSSSELFDLISKQAVRSDSEKDSQDAKGSLKSLYQMLRFELFNRRGTEASHLQNKLLGSWLKHWCCEKLSFINNHEDKKVWLTLLDAALKDPQISFEHKIRCCFFINKLFPGSQTNTLMIIQTIFTGISNEIPSPLMIECFSTEFSQDNIQQIIASLNTELNASDRAFLSKGIHGILPKLIPSLYTFYTHLVAQYPQAEFEAAARSLGAIAPHASITQCDEMIDLLLSKLHAQFLDSYPCIVEVLVEIAPHASQAQRDKLITLLLSYLHKVNSNIQDAVIPHLGTIASYAPLQMHVDAIFPVLIATLNHSSQYARSRASDALGRIAAYASQIQCEEMFTALIIASKDTFDPHQGAALGAILPYISETQRNGFLTSFLADSDDAEILWKTRLIFTTPLLKAMAAYLSDTNRDPFVSLLLTLDPNADRFFLANSYNTLCTLGPHVSAAQADAIVALLLTAWANHPDLRSLLVYALLKIAPHASKTASDSMIHPVLTQLNDDNAMIRHHAASILNIIVLRTSDSQWNAIITAVSSQLNDGTQKVRETALTTLSVLANHLPRALLKQLHELPGEPNVQRMILKLIVETRLQIDQINTTTWNPKKDLGIDFSRIESVVISQYRPETVTRTWCKLRTLRLWSNARAVDDCMTEVPNKNKPRWNEV